MEGSRSSKSSGWLTIMVGTAFLVAVVAASLGSLYLLYFRFQPVNQASEEKSSGREALRKFQTKPSRLTRNDKTNLIQNGSFNRNFSDWKRVFQVDDDDRWTVNLSTSRRQDTFVNYSLSRTNSDGAHLWLRQALDHATQSDTNLRLTLDLRLPVESYNRTRRAREFPVFVSIKYRTPSGETAKWRRGFYNISPPEAESYARRVKQGKWYRFRSKNLLGITPHPAKLLAVKFGAQGWVVHGQVDNLALLNASSS
ncbi:MAG: hypothetical protein ABEK50_06795 [bacterium]